MPPPDEQTKRVIELWITHARSDLALARSQHIQDAIPAAYAFHAQQAAEKSLKAVLIHHGIDPPRTHNVRDLVAQVERDTPDRLPEPLHDGAHDLTQYAVESRYPDVLGDVPERDVEAAVTTAGDIFEWALGILGLT
jgi:HEPN domain-containing protein